MLKTEVNKISLAKSLLHAVCETTSIKLKRHLSKWIHDIGGEAQLDQLNDYSFSSDDLEILLKVFPAKRSRLEKYLKSLEQ